MRVTIFPKPKKKKKAGVTTLRSFPWFMFLHVWMRGFNSAPWLFPCEQIRETRSDSLLRGGHLSGVWWREWCGGGGGVCPGGGGQVCLLEDQGQFGPDGDLPRGAPRHTWRASRGLPGGRGLLAGAHRVWDLTQDSVGHLNTYPVAQHEDRRRRWSRSILNFLVWCLVFSSLHPWGSLKCW